MIVAKALNMASLMNIPVLGLVENYSYFTCPDCGKKHSIYGESNIDAYAEEAGTQVLAKLPIDPSLASLCDKGIIELNENTQVKSIADAIEKAFE